MLRLGVGDSQAEEDADRMKFVHQQRWSWLQSLGRKGQESAQMYWGQDIGFNPWVRVSSEDDPVSWDQSLRSTCLSSNGAVEGTGA